MSKVRPPFCKVGDWIILTQEFMRESKRQLPDKMFRARKVISVEVFIDDYYDIKILTDKGNFFANSENYRFATEQEIKKEKMRTLFREK